MIPVSLNFEEVDIIHAGKQLVESDCFFKATFWLLVLEAKLSKKSFVNIF